MVSPHVVSSDNASQKSIPFMMKEVQKALADSHMVVIVLFCELFWNSSCRNFMNAKSVVDDFMCRTMTDVHMLCYFVNGRPLVMAGTRIMAGTRSMVSSVLDVDGCPDHSSTVTLV